jgi:hypothetical protein
MSSDIAFLASAAKAATKEDRVATLVRNGAPARQGDIVLFAVARDHPHGEPISGSNVQLAVGTTRGARHCAELPDGWAAYTATAAPEAVIGNVLLIPPPDGGTVRVTHPEHAHHVLTVSPGDALLACSQRNYADEMLRRRQD